LLSTSECPPSGDARVPVLRAGSVRPVSPSPNNSTHSSRSSSESMEGPIPLAVGPDSLDPVPVGPVPVGPVPVGPVALWQANISFSHSSSESMGDRESVWSGACTLPATCSSLFVITSVDRLFDGHSPTLWSGYPASFVLARALLQCLEVLRARVALETPAKAEAENPGKDGHKCNDKTHAVVLSSQYLLEPKWPRTLLYLILPPFYPGPQRRGPPSLWGHPGPHQVGPSSLWGGPP